MKYNVYVRSVPDTPAIIARVGVLDCTSGYRPTPDSVYHLAQGCNAHWWMTVEESERSYGVTVLAGPVDWFQACSPGTVYFAQRCPSAYARL